ncbi:GNAT family N-acetyltransferase [Solicola gregarius]|uniref:GNAT family N-acetyltransferase n=1 Tax=Solicola gregarius TaxID=2908642 RepID=A0AA46TG49_9ACTN|nr:GNAT family N-acetyltransferase [Solicola gregarius]UYM04187.1 GNAT family N-acetyltransferase [Solicola gregarius]
MDRSVVIRKLYQPGDLGWVVMTHGETYAKEYGWTAEFEQLVARIIGEYAAGRDSAREAAWIAEVDGDRAGCIGCFAGEQPDLAVLRVLLVQPHARGLGVGARLVEECVGFARLVGYRRMTLWTVGMLSSARRLYQAAGFRLIDERPEHRFGHDVVGQNWELDLDG